MLQNSRGAIIHRGRLSGGRLSLGAIVSGGDCPGGDCLGGDCPGGECPGGECPRPVYFCNIDINILLFKLDLKL